MTLIARKRRTSDRQLYLGETKGKSMAADGQNNRYREKKKRLWRDHRKTGQARNERGRAKGGKQGK